MARPSAPCRSCAAVAALGLLALSLAAPAQQPQKPKEVLWTHAFDLACRKYGEEKWTKDTQKFGVEAYRDTNNDFGLYVSQTGSVAATKQGFSGFKGPLPKVEGPKWLTGLDLPARKGGEKEFTKDTKVHSMEVYTDPNTNDWLVITEKGNLATSPVRGKPGSGAGAPKFVHGVDLKVRKGGVKEFKQASTVGVELYRDGNTGELIYIAETGTIVLTPEATPIKGEGKAPDHLHGLDLYCRKHDEKAFSKDTRRFGIEVFHDAGAGQVLYICESGSIAAVPAPKDLKAPTPKVKEPHWTHGLNVKVRSYGEKDFSDKTKVYGIEVFRDENLGVTLYICETGAIAAVK